MLFAIFKISPNNYLFKTFCFMKKYIGISLLFTTLFSLKSFAQSEKKYFISPGVKFGYTFGAGFSYGATIDVGVTNNSFIDHGKYGLSFNYTFIKVKKYTHRMRTINLMAQNDFACIKLGIGSVRNPWGYGKRNKCIVHGTNIDLSFAYPNKFSPWVGLSYFKYQRAAWAWFNKPYTTLYLNYKYDVLSPMYNNLENNNILK